jgi:hypothetical protein
MDNLNTHCRKSLTDHLGDREGRYVWSRLKVHYTPKHGSWLNQAEIELSLVSRQCLGTRRIPDLGQLTASVNSWNARANRDRTRIRWKFSRKAARSTFGYQRNTSTRSETYVTEKAQRVLRWLIWRAGSRQVRPDGFNGYD